MKTPPYLPELKKAAAFTLIEMLASITVLAIMVTILSAVFNSVSQSLRYGLGTIDNQTRARLALDVITRDVEAGVFRKSNLTAFKDENSDAFAFFSCISGIGTDRNVSALLYQLNPQSGSGSNIQYGVLRRGSYALGWNPSSAFELNFVSGSSTIPLMVGSVANSARNDASTVAEGVLQFEYAFLNEVEEIDNSTATKTNTSNLSLIYKYKTESLAGPPRTVTTRTRFLRISLAVVNEQGIKQLVDTGTLASLTTRLDLTDSERVSSISLIPAWEQKVNNPEFIQTLPPAARSGLKFFERFISIPSSWREKN